MQWARLPPRPRAVADRPEAIRPIRVPGAWGYVAPLGVAPGGEVGVHLSVEGPHELEVARLGCDAILDAGGDRLAERADREVVFHTRSEAAAQQVVRPGSYVGIDTARIVERPLTLSVWVRLWRLPVADTLSFAWAGLIADFDFPERCHLALLVDFAGRVGLYAGDGGSFRHEHLFISVGAPGRRPRVQRGQHRHVGGARGRRGGRRPDARRAGPLRRRAARDWGVLTRSIRKPYSHLITMLIAP